MTEYRMTAPRPRPSETLMLEALALGLERELAGVVGPVGAIVRRRALERRIGLERMVRPEGGYDAEVLLNVVSA